MERKRVGTVRWSIRLASLAVAPSSGEGPGDEATLAVALGGAASFIGGAGTSNEQTSNEQTKLNTECVFEPRQSAMPSF